MTNTRRSLLSGLLALSCFPLAAAQGASPSLQELSRRAGCIFSGVVLSIQHVSPGGPYAAGTTKITFRVEQAIRGVRAGRTLTVNEWSGLWDAGERYRVGERVLLFLHPAGKLGLTSPVALPFGRFAVNASGEVLVEQARRASLSKDPVLRSPLRTTTQPGTARIRTAVFSRAVRRALEK